MSPSELKGMTLKQLNQIFLTMMSSEWDEALEGQPKEKVTEAAERLLSIQRARLRLGNIQLAEIRDALKENEDALTQGKQELEQVLGNLQDVQKVLATTSAFLGIVGRIVTLAA
jgi:hypothetical protein